MTADQNFFQFVRTRRALLAIAFGASFLVVHVLDSRGPRAFLIEMRSDVPATAQLFYDIGDNFVEGDSVSVRIEPATDYVTLQFVLPDRHIRRFRFDPLNVPGTFSLRNARVIDRSYRTFREFAPRDLIGANQIASRSEDGDAVSFTTSPGATDASVHINQLDPASAPLFSWQTLARVTWQATIALLITGALAAIGIICRTRVEAVSRLLDGAAAILSDAPALIIDRFAVAYGLAIVALFVVAVAAGLHGSSMSMLADRSIGESALRPLLGVARPVRSDEYSVHSPAILNQLYRAEPFAVESSAIGPASAALLANLPVRHFTTLFRPQFWGFFLLPPAYGFAFYWQFKALLLLSGVFALLLLLTRSSGLAAFGTFWYATSAYVQWTYSWPSLLPEMVGLFGLVMCSLFYMTIGRRGPLLFGAAIVCVTSAIDFALGAYIPHQIPMVWFGVFLCVWWVWVNWTSIFTREYAFARGVALGVSALTIVLVMFAFYVDGHAAIATAAGTEYPGRRELPSGGYSVSVLFSHFFGYWADDLMFPQRSSSNICEVAGFLWLAPASAFMMMGHETRDARKTLAYGVIATFGVLLFIWLTVPLPAGIGSITFMNKSGTGRSLHVLGLVNVALVTIALSLPRPAWRVSWQYRAARSAALFAVVYPVLALTNATVDSFLTNQQLLLATVYVTIAIIALLEYQRTLLAALLIVPQLMAFGLVNPIDRGLRVVESSPLFQFVHARPELLQHRWLVYSNSVSDSGFLSAVGCDVPTGIRYLPDINGLSPFLPPGVSTSILNRSGVFITRLAGGREAARFELPEHHTLVWYVDPFDARLRQFGVRYAAFIVPPPPEVASRLRPLSPTPVSGYWLYELP